MAHFKNLIIVSNQINQIVSWIKRRCCAWVQKRVVVIEARTNGAGHGTMYQWPEPRQVWYHSAIQAPLQNHFFEFCYLWKLTPFPGSFCSIPILFFKQILLGYIRNEYGDGEVVACGVQPCRLLVDRLIVNHGWQAASETLLLWIWDETVVCHFISLSNLW